MRAMQTITRQPIEMVQVDTHQLKTNKGTIKVVVPTGPTSAERVYRESPQVVQHVIVPAFAKEGRQFKGKSSKIQTPVATVFRQENVKPKIQKQPREQVINSATQAQKNREQVRAQNMEAARQRTENFKRQGMIVEPGAVAKPGMQQGMQPGMRPGMQPGQAQKTQQGMQPGMQQGMQQGKAVEAGRPGEQGNTQGKTMEPMRPTEQGRPMEPARNVEQGKPLEPGKPAEQRAPVTPQTAPKPEGQKHNPPPSHGGK